MSDQIGLHWEIDGIAPETVTVARLPYGCTGFVVLDDVVWDRRSAGYASIPT